ncbi:MAG: M55 family metallopeptidase [Synergistaceae bacterium]|jgi:D-amino peptidase|nr:M55 family metallopeptidase [Synergistaceae bacterium]
MRIYISADMEGATGIVSSCQTDSNESEYSFGQKMQLHDVKAVVSGALDAGADEILINDSHWRMINLDIGELGFDSRVRLISGSPKALCMVEGFEGADAAFFVGYHAKMGTPRAILDHTISGVRVYTISLNGREVGETGLNAATCADGGVPVALVTGDAALCTEARELLGDGLVTARVKDARGRLAADCLLPEESARVLREAAAEAATRARDGRAPRMDIGDGTYDLRITFHNSAQCDDAAIVPGVERIGGRTVRVTGRGMTEMMRWTLTLISLAAYIEK